MVSGLMVALLAPGIGEIAKYVEAEAQRRIAAGDDAAIAYPAAMSVLVDACTEYKAKKAAEEEALCPPGEAKDGRLTLELGELLDRPGMNRAKKLRRRHLLDGVRDNVVYVVRDAGNVLYVGFTQYDASIRLAGHISGSSSLGRAIKQGRPRSDAWTVEMISHADKSSGLLTEKQLTEQYRPRYCAALQASAGD